MSAPKARALEAKAVAPAKPPRTSLHEPFSWVDKGGAFDAGAELAAMTMDVCHGIEVCLEIVSACNLEHEFNRDADPGQEELPLLNESDTSRLMRLAMVSARLLSFSAERHIARHNERAQKAGAA